MWNTCWFYWWRREYTCLCRRHGIAAWCCWVWKFCSCCSTCCVSTGGWCCIRKQLWTLYQWWVHQRLVQFVVRLPVQCCGLVELWLVRSGWGIILWCQSRRGTPGMEFFAICWVTLHELIRMVKMANWFYVKRMGILVMDSPSVLIFVGICMFGLLVSLFQKRRLNWLNYVQLNLSF